MISTLIRGGGVSLPNITKYREEYLVDTETNEIIYPKTRLEDIIGLENFSPDGGIDDSTYFNEVETIIHNISLASHTPLYTVVLQPGLYYIYGAFATNNTANPKFAGSVGDHQLRLYDATKNVYFTCEGMWLFVDGSGSAETSTIYKIDEPSEISLVVRLLRNTTFRDIWKSFRYIKLK